MLRNLARQANIAAGGSTYFQSEHEMSFWACRNFHVDNGLSEDSNFLCSDTYIAEAAMPLRWNLLYTLASFIFVAWPSHAAGVNLQQQGLNGSWYEPGTSGQGFMVQVSPFVLGGGKGVVEVSWLTYDSVVGGAERQRWYTLSGPVVTGQTEVSLTIYQNTGGNFNAPPITAAHPVGTATLRFDSCTSGQLAYQFADGSGRASTIPLTRLTPDVTCEATSLGSMNSDIDFSGNWYDPATSGQGIAMELNPISRSLFLAWQTYAPKGAAAGPSGQRWYTGQGAYVGAIGATTVVQLYETTGGLFDESMATPTTVLVGTGILTFVSCSTSKLSFSFTLGSSSGTSGTINLNSIDANLSGRGCWDY